MWNFLGRKTTVETFEVNDEAPAPVVTRVPDYAPISYFGTPITDPDEYQPDDADVDFAALFEMDEDEYDPTLGVTVVADGLNVGYFQYEGRGELSAAIETFGDLYEHHNTITLVITKL